MADNVSKIARSRIMAAVKSRDTAPEMVVRRLVHNLGFRFRLHRKSLPGTPDLVFPCRKKIINVHGCFWHMHTCGRCRVPRTRRKFWLVKLVRNKDRDVSNDRELRRLNWKVLTIWECQTKDAAALQKRVWRFLH